MVRQDYAAAEANGMYGQLPKDKLDNIVRVMYENFSSLCVFMEGVARHRKIWQLIS